MNDKSLSNYYMSIKEDIRFY